MNLNHPLDVATAPRAASTHWAQTTMTWSQVIDMTTTPATEKDCGGYLAGRLEGGVRRK
jgi:hypothetical protein